MLNIDFAKVRKGRNYNFAVQFNISSEFDEKLIEKKIRLMQNISYSFEDASDVC